MHFLEAAACYMRVDLRGANAGMSKQFLDDSQVRAMLQQVGSEAVPQHVRGHVSTDSRAANPLLDPQPKCYRGESGSALCKEHVAGCARLHKLRTAAIQILLQRSDCFGTDRHNAFLVAFADNDQKA